MTAEGALTDSALADKVKEFLTQFKDPTGSFSYVEQIDQMIVKQTTYTVSYTHLTLPTIYSV